MTRREALALLAVALLILGGRALRQHVLIGGDGAWRDPQWLADQLPDPPAEPAPEPSPAAAARTLAGPIDINTCARDTLEMLPGIGPALAGRILAARDRGVHFASAADLRQVKGIGPKLSAKLAPWLRFGPGGAMAP